MFFGIVRGCDRRDRRAECGGRRIADASSSRPASATQTPATRAAQPETRSCGFCSCSSANRRARRISARRVSRSRGSLPQRILAAPASGNVPPSRARPVGRWQSARSTSAAAGTQRRRLRGLEPSGGRRRDCRRAASAVPEIRASVRSRTALGCASGRNPAIPKKQGALPEPRERPFSPRWAVSCLLPFPSSDPAPRRTRRRHRRDSFSTPSARPRSRRHSGSDRPPQRPPCRRPRGRTR